MTEYNIEHEYTEMSGCRDKYLERARQNSAYTVPFLFPRDGRHRSDALIQPTDSLGARGVKTLASNLTLSLFPPNINFFELNIPDSIALKMQNPSQYKDFMQFIEKNIINKMEQLGHRPLTNHIFLDIIVSGGCVLYKAKGKEGIIYTLDQFCIRRDRRGKLVKLITKDRANVKTLSKELVGNLKNLTEAQKNGVEEVDIYQKVERDGERYKVTQYFGLEKVREVYFTYDLPFVYVPCIETYEDYGRSYIELFINTLIEYNRRTRRHYKSTDAANKNLFLIKPTSPLRGRIESAQAGDYLIGEASDISIPNMINGNNLQASEVILQKLKADLSFMFMLTSGTIRDAERVTREEINTLKNEIEKSALSDIYASLSTNYQKPCVKLYMMDLDDDIVSEELIKNVETNITTGVAALGRGNNFSNLMALGEGLTRFFGPQYTAKAVKADGVGSSFCYALGIDKHEVIKSQEEMQEEQLREAQLEALASGNNMEVQDGNQ